MIELQHYNKLRLYFDGGCWPNPGGPAVYGWTIGNHSGPYAEIVCGNGAAKHTVQTNNVAEYCGLGHGLRFLINARWKGVLQILGDNQLVINQLNNDWRCNKPYLQDLHNRCREHLQQLGEHIAVWIPRHLNKRADELSNLAYQQVTGRCLPTREEMQNKWGKK